MKLSFLKIKGKLMALAAMAVGVICFSSCEKIDFERIPPSNVRLSFDTSAEWQMYGTPGALDYKMFILSGNTRIPSNYPWTALTYTGYGGILLVGDITGAPYAFDLACPVEVQSNVRLKIDEDANEAYCPQCGSRFAVFTNYGSPISGEARKLKRGLRRFNVGPGTNGEYMLVTR
jgi:hypothetical protein